MNLKRNIRLFYAFSFLRELMFIIPVIVLFWQANNLSLTQIMILQSLFAISIVILEIPTGVVADRVGRKQSLMFGAFFLMVSAVVYSMGFTFLQFFIAEFIWAVGISFISGADSAFIYDTLKQTKKESKFKTVWGNAKSFSYFASGIAAIVGGFVAVYSLRLNWILVASGVFCALIISFFFVEPKHYKRVRKKSYFKHIAESFVEAFRNKNILFLLLFHALLATVSRISLWFYQPYMSQSGLNVAYFGLVWASFSIFAIGGSKFAEKIESIFKERISLWFIIFSMILSLFLMSYFFIIVGFVFLFIQQFIRGFAPPILQDYTHKHIPSDKRATLLSIQSFAGSLMFAITGPIFGYLADTFSLSKSLLFVAISFTFAFGLLMFWNKKRK